MCEKTERSQPSGLRIRKIREWGRLIPPSLAIPNGVPIREADVLTSMSRMPRMRIYKDEQDVVPGHYARIKPPAGGRSHSLGSAQHNPRFSRTHRFRALHGHHYGEAFALAGCRPFRACPWRGVNVSRGCAALYPGLWDQTPSGLGYTPNRLCAQRALSSQSPATPTGCHLSCAHRGNVKYC